MSAGARAAAPLPARKGTRRAEPAFGIAHSSLLQAARTLLQARGCALIAPGSPPAVLAVDGLDGAQVAALRDFAVAGEGSRNLDAGLLVLVPLRRGRTPRTLGLLFAGRSELSDAERAAIDAFALLSGAGAGPQRRSENRRLLAVSAIQQSISAQSPLVEVFRAMYERAAEEIDTPTFIAATLDDATQTARYVFAMQDGDERDPAGFPPRPLVGPLEEAIHSGAPQLIDDTTTLSRPGQAAILGDGPRPVRSLLIVPMVRRHEVIGVIEAQSYRPSAFTHEDVYLLSTLANQAAVALESARLLEESRRQVERLTLLNRVAIVINHATGVDSACQQALDLILTALPGFDMANVWLLDYDQPSLTRLASAGVPDDRPDGRASGSRLSLHDSFSAGDAVLNGRTQIMQVQAGSELPPETRPFVARNHIATVLHLPMRSGARIAGVLTLASDQRREVDQRELEFLETLAGQLGAQLEALLLHERHDEERRRLRAIIENLPEAIAITDAEGRVTTSNYAAEELWGHPPVEATLQQAAQAYGLCSPDGRPLPWQDTPVARALQQGEPSAGRELLIRRSDGSQAPILSNCVPVRDSQGKISGSVEVFQDISRLKELDRLKDNFINTVSHELRTPTTTIRGGALTLLRRGDSLDEATKRQLLRDMAEEGERLHILVEDLLSLSRAQAGMQLTTEPVIPHRFINRMILEMGGRVGDHTLTVDVPANLPMVEADLFCLEQIVRNLLENAVKFSPRGRRIEIAAEAGECEVIFSILDRGSGIPAKDIDRVFEPFYRSDEVVSAGAQGAGLGLAVCKRLVEMQGGRIWADARPGGGTVFHFTIPTVHEPAEEEGIEPEESQPAR